MSRTRTFVMMIAATAATAGLLSAPVAHARQAPTTQPAPQAQPPAAQKPAPPARPQGQPAGPPPGQMRNAPQQGTMLQRLGLTAAQQDQLKAFRNQQQKDVQAARERARAARQKLQETLKADVPDESAVRTAGAAMASAQVDLLALQARSRAQMMKVLTPEQQQQLRQMQTRMNQMRRRGMRGGGMMGRGGIGGPGGQGMGRNRMGRGRGPMGRGLLGPQLGPQMRRRLGWI